MNYHEILRDFRRKSPAMPLRGKIPLIDDKDLFEKIKEMFFGIIGIGIIFALVGWAIGYGAHYFFNWKNNGANIGFSIGILLLPLFPFIGWLFNFIRYREFPDAYFFEKFSLFHRIICFLAIAFFIRAMIETSYPYIHAFWLHHHFSELGVYFSNKYPFPALDKLIPTGKNDIFPFKSFETWAVIVGVILPMGFVGQAYRKKKDKYVEKGKRENTLSLWVGLSSGKLSKRSHHVGLAENQKIAISFEDASQNVLILGGIGSGKTTRAIHSFLIQLFDQNCGGLIFDIKGDFQKAVLAFSLATNRSVTTLGPSFESMNLLQGLTPEVASSFLKSAFLMSGKANMDVFWVETATELCRNSLGILQFLPREYSLYGLYRYLFLSDEREQIELFLEDILPTLDEKQATQLSHYKQYHTHVFGKFDEKVKSGVYATLAQVLSPFHHPELIQTFCSVDAKNFFMESVLDGNIYLVDLPLSVWGVGAKVVYSLIKLRFYNVMQQRARRNEWNQERVVFFMCDEFQEIVSANRDGLSDLNFWDKSRSSKTIGIISAQALSSFYAAIGDHDVTHALLQNFRQKICFRTEDSATLNYFNSLADKVDVIRTGISKTTGSQKNSGDIFTSSRSESTTENHAFVEKSVLSPQLFRQLTPNQAVALLSIQGHSMDDVIEMMPIYVD